MATDQSPGNCALSWDVSESSGQTHPAPRAIRPDCASRHNCTQGKASTNSLEKRWARPFAACQGRSQLRCAMRTHRALEPRQPSFVAGPPASPSETSTRWYRQIPAVAHQGRPTASTLGGQLDRVPPPSSTRCQRPPPAHFGAVDSSCPGGDGASPSAGWSVAAVEKSPVPPHTFVSCPRIITESFG